MSLARAYHEAYHAMLRRMEQVLKTADYPPYQDCEEPVKGPTLAEANYALAEAMASVVQSAMEELHEGLYVVRVFWTRCLKKQGVFLAPFVDIKQPSFRSTTAF
jgi:hypothetical protein